MTIKQLGKSSVRYDPKTGKFYWVVCYRKPWMVGREAARKTTNGYLYIKANGRMHSASRLAWELMNGQIPNGLNIDHINRNRTDNSPENLRVVTQSENLRNKGATGISGYKFVRIYNRPSGNGHLWRVVINGRPKYFKSIEDAKLAAEGVR